MVAGVGNIRSPVCRKEGIMGSADDDAYIDSDIGHPNPRAQHRGHMAFVVLILIAGIVAIVAGVVQSAEETIHAFATPSALLDGAAWLNFLSGAGRLTAFGLIVTAVALLWRRHIRRARRV
jgi:hypothetical protein